MNLASIKIDFDLPDVYFCKMPLKNLIIILILHGFILSVSAQDHYLLLTKERKIRASAGTVAGILVNAAYEELERDCFLRFWRTNRAA